MCFCAFLSIVCIYEWNRSGVVLMVLGWSSVLFTSLHNLPLLYSLMGKHSYLQKRTFAALAALARMAVMVWFWVNLLFYL